MQDLPHQYTVTASATPGTPVSLATEEGAELHCSPPSRFGGQAGVQSPEYLLAEALAGCFILSFSVVARASKLDWRDIRCRAVGTLDKVEGKLAFAEFSLDATLEIDVEADRELARKLLDKAERTCLISASLRCPVRLRAGVTVKQH